MDCYSVLQLRQKTSPTDIVYLPYAAATEQQTFVIGHTELPGYASPHPLLPWPFAPCSLALNNSLLHLTSILSQEQERCLRCKGCSGEKGGVNRSHGLPLCIRLSVLFVGAEMLLVHSRCLSFSRCSPASINRSLYVLHYLRAVVLLHLSPHLQLPLVFICPSYDFLFFFVKVVA